MNKKTILLAICLLVVGILPLLADTLYGPDNKAYEQTAQGFEGTNIWSLSMGGAGLGMKGYSESFLKNPANLPGSGFQLSIPSVTVTAFNIVKMLESPMIDYFSSGNENDMISGAQEFMKIIGKGHGDVLTTDLTLLTLNVGGLGLSVQAQERLMSYKTGTDMTSTGLIAQATAAATLGFGYNIPIIENWLNIDLGVSVQFAYKAYLERLGASKFLELIPGADDDDEVDPTQLFLHGTPLMAGWSLPISIGMNVNGPYGLSLSMVAKNINAKQYMTAYASMDDWALQNFGQSLSGEAASAEPILEEYEVSPGFRFDLGLTWGMNFGSNLLQPTISLDFVDVGQMAGQQGDDLSRAFWDSTRFGASLRVLNILDFRYGLNKGYQSIGLGLDLFVFHIDVAYYTLEYGKQLEDKPVDALSVRIGLLSR